MPDENPKPNVPPERQAYLRSLIATSRTNGYQLAEEDLVGLTEDEAEFLTDLLLEEQLDASDEDGLALAKSVGVRTGVRGTIQRWLNRDSHQKHWEEKAEAAKARVKTLSKVHPISARHALQEKTFKDTFPDFYYEIALGDKNTPPDEKSWGVITVNKNDSVNDNIAFIKTHIGNARRIKEEIGERLRTEEDKLNQNDHLRFQLHPLSKFEIEDALEQGRAILDIEAFISRVRAFATVLEANYDRLRSPILKTGISIGFSTSGNKYSYFSLDHYHITLNIHESDEEILTLIENITHADGPTKAAEYTGDTNDRMLAEEELSYSICLACAKIGREEMRFLVSEDDNFTEPTEKSGGKFSVAKDATRAEVEAHIKTHMPNAIKLNESALHKAHPLIFPE